MKEVIKQSYQHWHIKVVYLRYLWFNLFHFKLLVLNNTEGQ